MPTLLTWSRWTPPFLGLGPAISGRPGELRIPWAGAGGGERSPYHSRNSLPGSPCAWRRGVGAGIGWVGGQRTETQTQMGACRAWRGGRWSGERAGEGAGQSRAQGACTPQTRLPRFSEDLSISWRAMALVLPWQRLGCDPLLLTSPSPHKQSGRTHRPSRSCLFGSQSCEMQQ